jgi:hypothetical protein
MKKTLIIIAVALGIATTALASSAHQGHDTAARVGKGRRC